MKKNRSIAKSCLYATAVFGLFLSGAASATVNVTAVPVEWRMQNYTGSNTTLWYTGSVCQNGQLIMDPSDTPERNKLLWATIMAAKASKLKVTIDYDTGPNICVIRTFGLDKS